MSGADPRPTEEEKKAGVGIAPRLLVTIGLLVVLGLTLDPGDILAQLRRARLPWIGLALLVSVGQVALSAWRWRFTATRLGLPLSFARALREYYLATFLNQVLPGGVLGDVSRAWRHGREGESVTRGSAARAVLLERASGQMVMLATAAVCGAVLATGGAGGGIGAEAAVESLRFWRDRGSGIGGGLAAGIAGSVLLLGLWILALRWKGGRLEGVWERSWIEARRALLSPGAFLVQSVSSLTVVASYVLMFILAARAVGVEAPTALLVLLVPPVLLAMLIPLSFAGWGLREGAAALLWAAVGLSATEGTAASVMYGLLVLVSSLPGVLVLLVQRRSSPAPGRRGRLAPVESSGREDGGPDREFPPAGG
ncbi:MAG: lysylphosphatidylglycerol synthase transmembrane domain-containing protein [Longimicrobiales bacterium]|nr:lysylphosphatidylglycerol synthase transmembrane domain-containing protein [Longimicrobiales bacterium]